MKALIISDIDDFHWNGDSGKADILLSCGDIYDQVILEAATAFSCSKILAVKGNHDSSPPFPPPILDIHLHVETFKGVQFGGLNGSWKYKPRGHYLHEQSDIEQALASFPRVDVLISHNSPKGIHDKDDEVHIGFEALNQYLQRAKPKLLIHGHQHKNIETKISDTKVLGVYGSRLIDL